MPSSLSGRVSLFETRHVDHVLRTRGFEGKRHLKRIKTKQNRNKNIKNTLKKYLGERHGLSR